MAGLRTIAFFTSAFIVYFSCVCVAGRKTNENLMRDDIFDWGGWWTYSGISGPDYWGVMNSEWKLCDRGKYQSPINIDPETLVYDPTLTTLSADRKRVNAEIRNTGHDVTIRSTDNKAVIITGGPMAYRYQIDEVKLHFGSNDSKGSEHRVGGRPFSGEVQVFAFNKDLYNNMSTASLSPYGVTILSAFIQIGVSANKELESALKLLHHIRYKDQIRTLKNIDLVSLLPSSKFYMTYEGSFTHPPCNEVVTWILFNKPVKISRHLMSALRTLSQVKQDTTLKTKMENNFRKPVPLRNRTIRTNIKTTEKEKSDCIIPIKVSYEVNPKFKN